MEIARIQGQQSHDNLPGLRTEINLYDDLQQTPQQLYTQAAELPLQMEASNLKFNLPTDEDRPSNKVASSIHIFDDATMNSLINKVAPGDTSKNPKS